MTTKEVHASWRDKLAFFFLVIYLTGPALFFFFRQNSFFVLESAHFFTFFALAWITLISLAAMTGSIEGVFSRLIFAYSSAIWALPVPMLVLLCIGTNLRVKQGLWVFSPSEWHWLVLICVSIGILAVTALGIYSLVRLWRIGSAIRSPSVLGNIILSSFGVASSKQEADRTSPASLILSIVSFALLYTVWELARASEGISMVPRLELIIQAASLGAVIVAGVSLATSAFGRLMGGSRLGKLALFFSSFALLDSLVVYCYV